MAEGPEKANSDDPQQTVCSFFRKSSKAKNIRKRTAIEEGENEDGDSKDETSVVFNKKKPAVADNKLHFSTGPSKREITSESDAGSKKSLFQFESSREIQVQNDNKATATLETETEFSKDARAIRERVLKQAEEALKGKNENTGDEKLYKGIHGYTDYKAGFRREHTISSEKAGGSHGPLRASAHIRVSARFDYQPDICKDYKETGYCGYGDSCKFMHDRGDYKSGWQLEKEWDEAEKAKKRRMEMGMLDDDESAEQSDAFGALHRSSSLTLPSRAGILIGILPRIPLIDRFPPAYYTINFSEENPRQPGMLQAKRLGFLDAEIFLRGSLRSSSDGLICLSRGHGDVAVYNASTGKHVSLPAFKSRALLGFNSQAKRYKVLMINQPNSSSRFGNKHWIFTVGVDKSWREINYSLPHPFYPFDAYACPSYSDTSVHIDGVIYYFNWLTIYDPPSFHIVAFEVGSESYSLIPFPAEISSSSQYEWANYVLGNFALLQVDGGRLAILLREYCLCYMNVWIWEKSKECWEKITMTIPLEESRVSHKSLRYTTNYAGEIVLLYININKKQLSILVCNLKSEVWRKFDVGGIKGQCAFFGVVRTMCLLAKLAYERSEGLIW